jgi:hypothetical protein
MNRFRFCAGLATALLLGLSAGGPAPLAWAQDPKPPRKSVYGKLERVVEGRRTVVMMSDDGERLAWLFEPEVLDRVLKFEPGAPMIVIYRQTSPGEKIATAVAFPGTASSPTYVNTTGERVVLRSGPAVDGACDRAEAVNEISIIEGGLAQTADACWCCAPDGEACAPGNQTGLGKAFLLRCF